MEQQQKTKIINLDEKRKEKGRLDVVKNSKRKLEEIKIIDSIIEKAKKLDW